MEQAFWHEKWRDNKIGFHQERVNTRLQHWWPRLGLAPGSEVLVPLCGKSLDMLWLHQQGYRVLGVELSEEAVQAFFVENGLDHDRETDADGLIHFIGTGAAAGLRLIAGDIFAVSPELSKNAAGCYDRACFVAFPDAMRRRYADHLARLLPAASTSLLITMDYDPTKMTGPPFAVSDSNARELLAAHFIIDELESSMGSERLGNLKDRGLDSLKEHIYSLQRRSPAT